MTLKAELIFVFAQNWTSSDNTLAHTYLAGSIYVTATRALIFIAQISIADVTVHATRRNQLWPHKVFSH